MWPSEEQALLLEYFYVAYGSTRKRKRNSALAHHEKLNMIVKLWAPYKKKDRNVRKIPNEACRALITHFNKNREIIHICGREYYGAKLSLDSMLEFARENPFTPEDKGPVGWRYSGYFNTIEDYRTGGMNPWEDAYEEMGAEKFAVHFDEEPGLDLVWVACDPDDEEVCGTAFCRKDIDAKHTAENPLPMTLDDMEIAPKETLICVNLDSTAHAPPSLQSLRRFKQRLFMMIDYRRF